MILNATNASINMSTPFIIKAMIEYVKTGQNPTSLKYWDTKDTFMSFLTPET